MKSWIKNKRKRAGFIEHDFTSCAICPAGVVLHEDHCPPVISCGDARGARENHLFTVQEVSLLCPRELKKQKTAAHEEREQKKKRKRLYRYQHTG